MPTRQYACLSRKILKILTEVFLCTIITSSTFFTIAVHHRPTAVDYSIGLHNPTVSQMPWITDGSDQLVVQADRVVSKNPEPGKQQLSSSSFNAMWVGDEGLACDSTAVNREVYWQVRFPTLEGSAFVGVTTPEQFHPGFKIRCLCYGQNLSDGSRALVTK